MPRCVVTPGNHDGVHLGHRALVAKARQLASEESPAARVVTLTFHPHPVHFMAPERAPMLLTSPERRAELLRGAGADDVITRRFDAMFAALAPESFVDDILIGELGACTVVVGTDFRFGAARAGDVTLLESLGSQRNLRVVAVPPVMLDGQLVSSSQVRAALARGDVGLAARMLTRVHEVEQRVIHGDKQGRLLGFPTANLALDGITPPADGVYAVALRVVDADAELATQRWCGIANLGVRPTRSAGRSLEVHVLDFDRDLYGHRLRVGFVARLRGEEKFSSLTALRTQIARDIDAARAALESSAAELLAWI